MDAPAQKSGPLPPAADIAEFTKLLTAELASETLELPSFPEVAMQVRKALGNPEVAVDDVVRMVSAEPSLAVRLLQLANSVALNPNAQRITSLRLAVSRIGFNLARSATIAFAMSQMRRAEAWRGLEVRFRELWEESAGLAAMSHVVAKRSRNVMADQAMFAGMLHAVGKLFLLTRLNKFPVLLNTPAFYADIERAWHPRVARALLTRWEVESEIISASCDFLYAAQPRSGFADLRDVLFAARYIGTLAADSPEPDAQVFDLPPFHRLGLMPQVCGDILKNSADEVASLRASLVD